MIKASVTHQLHFHGPLGDFDERASKLLDALSTMSGVEDVDMAVTLTSGDVDVVLVVEAEDVDDALAKSYGDVRAAIHTIGDATPGWESYLTEMGRAAKVLRDENDEDRGALAGA